MNYQNLYDKIIKKYKKLNLTKKDNRYLERHHIIPKSMGGTNDAENLVNLTGKAHFICHLLLSKIKYDNPKIHQKMVYAFHLMIHMNSPGQDRPDKSKLTSRIYNNVRKEYKEIISEKMRILNTGIIRSEETRRKMSLAHKGERNSMYGRTGDLHPKGMLGKKHTEETKNQIRGSLSGENNPMYGKEVSIETRKKIGNANRGRIKTDEVRNKLSISSSNRIWINNDTEQKFIKKDELINYDMNVWKLGMIKGRKLSEETKKKMSISKLGHLNTHIK